jgi:hypothetical protein
MMIGRGSRSTRRKPAPVPLCPPQTPNVYPDANPGLHGGKPATNRLSYGTALRSTHPPTQWIPEVKWPWRETDHSPPTNAEVKKMCIYTSTLPYGFCCVAFNYLRKGRTLVSPSRLALQSALCLRCSFPTKTLYFLFIHACYMPHPSKCFK